MLDDETKRFIRKTIIAFGFLMLIALVVFILVVPAIKKISRPAFLDILVAPLDSIVQIDGNTYGNGVYEFEPGTYVATISSDGFESKTIELELEKNKTTDLYLYLEQDNGKWDYYQKRHNAQSLDALLKINGYSEPTLSPTDHDETDSDFVHAMSISAYMPVYFSICGEPASRMNCDAISIYYDYSEQCNNELCLIITGRRKEINQETLTKVNSELQERGFSLNDYKYTYIQNTER